jgi:hypothetical protein
VRQRAACAPVHAALQAKGDKSTVLKKSCSGKLVIISARSVLPTIFAPGNEKNFGSWRQVKPELSNRGLYAEAGIVFLPHSSVTPPAFLSHAALAYRKFITSSLGSVISSMA